MLLHVKYYHFHHLMNHHFQHYHAVIWDAVKQKKTKDKKHSPCTTTRVYQTKNVFVPNNSNIIYICDPSETTSDAES